MQPSEKKKAAPAKRRLLLYGNIGLAVLGLAALFYLYLLDVRGVPFVCLVQERWHLYCPGCGMSRALRALLHGDLWGSFCAHPFVLCGIFCLLYYEVAFFRHGRASRLPALWLVYGLLLFAVLRNVLLYFGGFDPLGDLTGEVAALIL